VHAGREFQTRLGKCCCQRTTFGAGEEARQQQKRKQNGMRMVRRHVAVELCDAALRLRSYFQDPGAADSNPRFGRSATSGPPAGTILRRRVPCRGSLGTLLRASSVSIHVSFGDDTCAILTARLDTQRLRQALAAVVTAPSGTKAFDPGRRIGWPSTAPVPDGNPQGSPFVGQNTILRNRSLVINIIGDDQCVGTGLTLPCDVEPTGRR